MRAPTWTSPRRVAAALAVFALVATATGCARRARLEMGGLNTALLANIPANAAAMGCTAREGLRQVAIRCPGILYPESTVELDMRYDGFVQCVTLRDQEDDCPLVTERLLGITR